MAEFSYEPSLGWESYKLESTQENNGFPGGSGVKNPLAMQEMQIQSLSGEDPLEEGMVSHSSILARRIAWTEKPGRLHSIEFQRV